MSADDNTGDAAGNRDVLSMWVIYDHPPEFPTCYVARRWDIRGGPVMTSEHLVGNDLFSLREQMLMRGLVVIPRAPEDDRFIIESWM